MDRYEIDRCCDGCSMSKAKDGGWVDVDDLDKAIESLVDHLWDSDPSTNLRDKRRLDDEIRAFFN